MMAQNTTKPASRSLGVLVLIIAAIIIAAVFLTRPDSRTAGERIGDAAQSLENGDLKDAGRQLERRTPGQKLGDAVKDTGEDIKRNTANP
jgi:hypothetical protein